MFDSFIAEPPLRCRSCGSDVSECQGKDGPCSLFVWKQGIAGPVRQTVDDEYALPDVERATFRLPDEFEIYTGCPSCHAWITGTGYCSNRVWTSSLSESTSGRVRSPRATSERRIGSAPRALTHGRSLSA